jgi:flagellar basal-body rod protein FlgB
MEPIYLFNLVNLERGWLSARQSLVSQNIANANTPGYKALDAVPFTKILDQSSLQMTGDNPLHQQPPSGGVRSVSIKEDGAWETTHSGNNVSLESEMIKAGEVRGAFSLDTNILKTFQGMWLASLKG